MYKVPTATKLTSIFIFITIIYTITNMMSYETVIYIYTMGDNDNDRNRDDDEDDNDDYAV